jgi:hypothetical protein
MKISILAATALLIAGTTAAMAAWDQDQTIVDLQAQGFTRIEIVIGATQAKVEASNGTTKVETIYDLATGGVVKTESESIDPSDVKSPGVGVRTTNRDTFISDDDHEDDHGGVRGGHGADDEADDDHGGGDDDEDDGEDDHGDHDGGDDDGGDDDGGDDDDGDDD